MEPIDIKRQAIAATKARVSGSYPFLWREIIREWSSGETADSAWLTYAANYLFSTAGVRWALDPLSLAARVPGIEPPDFNADLRPCELVVLSHNHKDHLDLDLIRALQSQPLQWVIPQHMLHTVLARADIPSERIIVPEYGKPMHFSRLTLTAFEGLHLAQGRGVPSTGYLAEFGGKRWLFPGDTRRYDLTALPDFGRLDGVFAHLWLGRAAALLDPPPLLESFCRFFAGLHADRLVVTHLHELGRDADDYWDEAHFQAVSARFRQIAPTLRLAAATLGERVPL